MSNLHADTNQNNVISEQATSAFTFRKSERLCSKKQIEKLFEGGSSRSMTAFPLRTVFRFIALEDASVKAVESDPIQGEEEKTSVKLLISVPKKHFKRAVKRNRVKRQVREAYRKNRSLLDEVLRAEAKKELLLSFIWLDDKLHDTEAVEKQVCNLLRRIGESR